MTKRLKYLYSDVDRHGNQRQYFKPPGHKKHRLQSAPGTAESRREYEALMSSYTRGNYSNGAATVDSIEWLLNQYIASSVFNSLAPATKIQRRNFFMRFCRVYGAVPYKSITATDLSKVRDNLKPFAARNFLKAMTAAYKWGAMPEVNLVTHNPARDVQRPSPKTDGFEPWTLEDVKKFNEFYPKGHNARVCLAMLLFTGREISAVRTMGRKNVRNGFLTTERQKTGVKVVTPILGLLQEELGSRYNNLVWLQTNRGAPYSNKSLPQKFSAWARRAGLENKTSHGLRKSVGSILADLQMPAPVIMSVLGHKSMTQSDVYIRNANRADLAEQGMNALEEKVAHFWA